MKRKSDDSQNIDDNINNRKKRKESYITKNMMEHCYETCHNEKCKKKMAIWKTKFQAEEYIKKMNDNCKICKFLLFGEQISLTGARRYIVCRNTNNIEIINIKKEMKYHELCDKNHPMKLFFDIEWIPSENIKFNFDNTCFFIASKACKFINELLGINLNVNDNVTFLTASRKTKNSMHIIFDSTLILSSYMTLETMVKMFIDWMIRNEIFKEDNNKKYILLALKDKKIVEAIDMVVYKNLSLRTYYSTVHSLSESEDTRLYEYIPKITDDEINWHKKKEYDSAVFLKTLIQFFKNTDKSIVLEISGDSFISAVNINYEKSMKFYKERIYGTSGIYAVNSNKIIRTDDKMITKIVDVNDNNVKDITTSVLSVYKKAVSMYINTHTQDIGISKASIFGDNMMTLIIKEGYCLIVRESGGTMGHKKKYGKNLCENGIYIIVNVKYRTFYQKCLHGSCSNKKSSIFTF